MKCYHEGYFYFQSETQFADQNFVHFITYQSFHEKNKVKPFDVDLLKNNINEQHISNKEEMGIHKCIFCKGTHDQSNSMTLSEKSCNLLRSKVSVSLDKNPRHCSA